MYDSVHLFGESPGLTQDEQHWNEIIKEQHRQSAAYRDDIYGTADYLGAGNNPQTQDASSSLEEAPTTAQAPETSRFKPGRSTSIDNIWAQRFGWRKDKPQDLWTVRALAHQRTHGKKSVHVWTAQDGHGIGNKSP